LKANIPQHARILVVGAGTGMEIIEFAPLNVNSYNCQTVLRFSQDLGILNLLHFESPLSVLSGVPHSIFPEMFVLKTR
jgi:hypothetical protein